MGRTSFIAVTTVLSILLLISIIVSSLWFFFQHRRHNGSTDSEAAAQSQTRIQLVPRNAPLYGWDHDAVRSSFIELYAAVDKYVSKWMLCKDESAVLGDDSPSRIEDLLFKNGLAQEDSNERENTRPFPNQHKYAPREINSLLRNKSSREAIAHHIIMSILLNAVSLEGNDMRSLLPLDPGDLCSLLRLREALRGVPLSTAVEIHVYQFGAYHGPGVGSTSENSEDYIKLFESIFKPYVRGETSDDEFERCLDLKDVLLQAADHGMKLIGCPNYEFLYEWGERDLHNILIYPGLSASVYQSGRFERIADLIEPRPVVVRGEGY